MAKRVKSETTQDGAKLGPGTVVADKFRVVRTLAEGAMGRVYLAEQQPLGREVALKVMRSHLTRDEVAVQRFFREALAISKLVHPNVVTLIDYGETDAGSLYLAMEYVPGKSLSDVLEREGKLDLQRALRIFAQVVLVLAEAHKKGLIHRDLKPSNILVCKVEGQPDFVKVIDFGVVRLREADGVQSITQAGFTCGTPEYMSPEQALGEPIDPRSDLYTLGVVLFEMLEGRRPFSGTSLMAFLSRRARTPSLEMSERVPRSIRELTGRLLEFDRADRPDSAEELLHQLQEALPPGVRLPPMELPGRDSAPVAAATAPTVVAALPAAPSVQSMSTEAPETPRPQPDSTTGAGLQSPDATPVVLDRRSREATTSRTVDRAGGRPWMLIAGIALVVAAFLWLAVTQRDSPEALQTGADEGSGAAEAVAPGDKEPSNEARLGDQFVSADEPKPPDAEERGAATSTLVIRTLPNAVEVVDLATGRTLGYAPLDLPVARSKWPIRLRFRRAGYRPAQRDVIPDHPRVLVDVSLEPEASTGPAATTPRSDGEAPAGDAPAPVEPVDEDHGSAETGGEDDDRAEEDERDRDRRRDPRRGRGRGHRRDRD